MRSVHAANRQWQAVSRRRAGHGNRARASGFSRAVQPRSRQQVNLHQRVAEAAIHAGHLDAVGARGQRISSKRGIAAEPAFALGFKDAAYGFATMTAKNKQLAFMQGIQNKDIQIQGNPALVMWFQGLTKYLMPKKKTEAPKKAA